jgi:ribonuclease P/MRP protein subunit RPP1
MFVDIVIPKNNELDFIKIAKRLDFEGLVFVYDNLKEYKDNFLRVKEKEKNLKLFSAFLVDNKKINKPKEFDLLVVKANENNRTLFENKNIDVVFDVENQNRADFIHQRNSGFNHVMAKLANEKNIILGVNFSGLLNLDKSEQIKRIGRIMQNIKLCQKYNVEIKISSYALDPYDMRGPKDLQAFGLILGMNNLVVKKVIFDKSIE